MTKYINKLRKNFATDSFPVFTLTDTRVLLDSEGISRRYLKMLINHLITTKEIRRISRGVYTFHDDIAVVGFAFRPFYYGLEDALSYRNLWTQATNPVVMTTGRAREGLRKFDGANYIVKRVKPSFFFGFNFIKHYEMWLPVSDPEKTLIDLVYYGHGVRDDALANLANAIDTARLDEYLKSYGKVTRKAVYSQLNKTSHDRQLPNKKE
jgi:predicted transcriptional regulator of viral defense system